MEGRNKFFTAVILLLLGFLASVAIVAKANTPIVAQTTESFSVWQPSPASSREWDLPDGSAGLVEAIELSGVSSYYHYFGAEVAILCYTDEARTTLCPAGEFGDGTAGQAILRDGNVKYFPETKGHVSWYPYSYTTDDQRTMLATRFYKLYVGAYTPGGDNYLYGTLFAYPYVVISGISAYDSTNITSITSPDDGAVLSSNIALLAYNFHYVEGDPYDRAGVTIQDITGGTPLEATSTQFATTTGDYTYTKNFAMTLGHTYQWQPVLFNGSPSGENLYGASRTFSFGTAGGTGEYATTTMPSLFENLWLSIQTKPPFGFIFQLRTQLEALNASSTPAVSITIPTWIKENFFDPMDIGLASILWLVFGVWGLKRMMHFDL